MGGGQRTNSLYGLVESKWVWFESHFGLKMVVDLRVRSENGN